jgi:hypothetical protein
MGVLLTRRTSMKFKIYHKNTNIYLQVTSFHNLMQIRKVISDFNLFNKVSRINLQEVHPIAITYISVLYFPNQHNNYQILIHIYCVW